MHSVARFLYRWSFVILVLALDVVTVAYRLFHPAVRIAVVATTVALLLLFALLRLIELRHIRAQERAAFASLARLRAGS